MMDTKVPHVKFREQQAMLLASYTNSDPNLSFPHVILLGYSGSGKSFVLEKHFEANSYLHHIYLRPIELVYWKALTQAIARNVQAKLRQIYPEVTYPEYDPSQVEESYLLIKFLNNLFSQYNDKIDNPICLYVVVDKLDSLNDLDAMIFNQMAKLHEYIDLESKICLKFIYTINDPSFVERYSTQFIPTIVFQRYTMEEILDILTLSRAKSLVESQALKNKLEEQRIEGITDKDLQNIAKNFIQLILQSFHSYTGNDLNALNDLIDFKWSFYVDNITQNTWDDPLELYRRSNQLFSRTEDVLEHKSQSDDEDMDENLITAHTYELSTISKYLLISSFLCSYIDSKYDIALFAKKQHLSARKGAMANRKESEMDPTLRQPALFSVERVLAIFQAIYPVAHKNTRGSLSALQEDRHIRANVEVFQNFTELYTLKLISTTVSKNIDFLSSKLKWKVNIPWEIIREISDSVQFPISDYFNVSQA